MNTGFKIMILIELSAFILINCAASGPAKLQDSMVFFENTIKFEQYITKIHPSSTRQLDKIGKMLVENPDSRFEIICFVYSDQDSISNTLLAGRRAKEIKKYLVNKKGINYNSLTLRGKGNSEPFTDQNGNIDKAKCNRIEFERIRD